MEGNINKNKRLYTFGPFRLDAAERHLFRDGNRVPLAGKAFDLLLILVANAGHLLHREELISKLWPDTIVEEQGLSTRIHILRQALGDERETPVYIETVRGVGYRFIATVDQEEIAPSTTAGQNRPAETNHRSQFRLAAGSAVLLAAVIVVATLFGTGILPSGGHGSSAPIASIAVLPFENLSSDKNNAYFAAGIQDEILTRLASLKNLKVIARTSTEQYQAHPPDIKTIADQLGVTTVLEGSVQKVGARVDINVQLIDARTRAHIWAQSYNRQLTDIFGVEGEVATQIAAALRAKLLPSESARLQRAPTRDPQAYLLLLKANYLASRLLRENSVSDPEATRLRASDLYREATARDPDFALAWARFSLMNSRAWWFNIGDTNSLIADAGRQAKRALALDPTLPQAHLAMGYIEYYQYHAYDAALTQFAKVRQSLPNNAGAIAAIAFVHRRQGKWKEALSGLRKATALDPRNPRRRYEIAVTLTELRRYPEAGEQLAQALAIEPDDYDAMTYRVRLLFLTGKLAQARRALAAIPERVNPLGLVSALRFKAALLARKPDAALAVLADAPDQVLDADSLYQVPTDLLRAQAYAMKGDDAASRHCFESARDQAQKALHANRDTAFAWSVLGLAEAGLGETAAAINHGKHAVRLLPIGKDAYYGSQPLAALAKIYARSGKTGQALNLLRRLLAMPSGSIISIPLLRLDPAWDPLRSNSGFQALLQRRAAPPNGT